MNEFSIAHAGDHGARRYQPDGNVPWREAIAPDIAAGRTTGRLKGCSYCGSMHPADLAAAIRAGATASWADWKYGWPHKAYIKGVPNPHAGMLESLCSKSNPTQEEKDSGAFIEVPAFGFDQSTGKPNTTWAAAGRPAPATVGQAKFYTVHLQDASPEDRDTIERALHLRFAFDGEGVAWSPVSSAPTVPAPAEDGKAIDFDSAAAIPDGKACDLSGDTPCEACQ